MDISLLTCEGVEHTDLLAIDDLLDFSNDDIGGPIDSSENSTPSCELPTLSSHASSPKGKKPSNQAACDFDSGELCIPCDDLAELEWLSNFVEESFSSGDHAPSSLGFGSIGKFSTEESTALSDSRKGSSYQSTSPISVLASKAQYSKERAFHFNNMAPDMSVPARARSKRCRTAVCFWNTQILSAEASESLLESSSTTSTITSDSDMINTYYDHDDDDYDDKDDDVDDDDDEDDDIIEGGHLRYHQHKRMGEACVKAKKYSKVLDRFSNSRPKKLKVQQDGGLVRKCLHCATQKTPQWRAGPMGPKTLCNACGVRYKSGRLCAEYRPAASPTFVESVHSNSHRKVLEMRRQRGEIVSASGMRQ